MIFLANHFFSIIEKEIMFRLLEEKDYLYFSQMLYHNSKHVLSKNDFVSYLKSLHMDHQVWIRFDVEDRVIAFGTILFQRVCIPTYSLVAHIQDIVVLKSHKNTEIGKELCHVLLHYAKKRGCSKTFLNSNLETIPFLENCFENKNTKQFIYYYE